MTTLLSNFKDSTRKLFLFLFYSLTKPQFYKDILKDFKGYGFRFIFTLTFIGTLFTSVILVNKLAITKLYFENKVPTNMLTENIENILGRWEDIRYNGYSISSENDDVSYISGPSGKSIIAVDANDVLKGDKRNEIPVIFGSKTLLLNLPLISSSATQIPYEYQTILGSQERIITADTLFNLMKKYVFYIDKIFIYMVFPLSILLNLVMLISEKIFMTLIIYLVLRSYVKSNKKLFQTSIRLVAFSCGLTALLLPVVFMSKYIGYIINISQLVTSFYIIYAISSSRQNNKNNFF